MGSTFSTARYLATMLLTMAVLSVAAVMLPHDPYIRYQSLDGTMFERSRYFYERLHFDPAPVDVVIVGASRTAAGVSTPLLEQDLKKRGLNLRVANLAFPAAAMDASVVEAREALKARPNVKLLIVSVTDALPRDGHAPFAELATTGDALRSPILVNSEFVRTFVRLPMRQMQLFVATQLPGAFGYKSSFDPRTYLGSSVGRDQLPGWKPPVPKEPYQSEAHKAVLNRQSALRKRLLTPSMLPDDLSWLEYGVSQTSINQLVDLSRKTHTRLVFLYLPFYDGPGQPKEEAWLRARAPLWSAGQIRHDPALFADSAHGSPLVLPVLSDWLANRIADELGGPGGQPANAEDAH